MVNASQDVIKRGLRLRCLTSFLFQACLFLYVQAGWLQAGPGSLVVLGAAALINLATFVFVRTGPRSLHPVANRLAPLLGIVTWAVLTYLGGGVGTSLLLVGFWFEILLSAVGHSVLSVVCVTLASAFALFAQQYFLGFADIVAPLVLQTSFLVIVGAATAWVRRSWVRGQESFSSRLVEQQDRLQAIEEQLADAQTLADLGAQTARIGHGLKNAVHSLRGFSSLIERGKDVSASDNAALRGLKDSIDQLERLALETLKPKAQPPQDDHAETCEQADSDLREVLDAAAAELTLCHPEVRCRVVWEKEEALRVPAKVLREVLSNLLLNAAESMNRTGEVGVRVEKASRGIEIQVTDTGPGIAVGMESHIFRPGHSTKSNGHGMGLYLARSLMESLGGSLSLSPCDAGASFRIALPDSRPKLSTG